MADRTPDEIDEAKNAAWDSKNDNVSKYPGMSYEDGVIAALDWITGDVDEHPMEEN